MSSWGQIVSVPSSLQSPLWPCKKGDKEPLAASAEELLGLDGVSGLAGDALADSLYLPLTLFLLLPPLHCSPVSLNMVESLFQEFFKKQLEWHFC